MLRQHAATPPATVAAPSLTLTEEIAVAAANGELQPVVGWLAKGGHVDALDCEDGLGLLHAAVAGGQLHVVKELLQRGASVDLRGFEDVTTLMLAALAGKHVMVRLLLEHKASVDLQNADGGGRPNAGRLRGPQGVRA